MISTLPFHLLLRIFSFVLLSDLCNLSLCCRRFLRVLSLGPSLWEGKFVKLEYRRACPSTGCHSMVLHRDCGDDKSPLQMIVYGGNEVSQSNGLISRCFSEISSFNFATRQWTVTNSLKLDQKRTEHKTIVAGNKLYSFSGTDQYLNTVSNEVWQYDLPVSPEKTMTKVSSINNPAQRAAHSAVKYNNLIYVYGGWNGINSFGDLHVYNIDTETWSVVPVHANSSADDIPPPRRKHSAVLHNDSMFIFGGFSEEREQREFNRVYRLDLRTHVWTQIRCRGEAPTGRSRADAVVWRNFMFVLGGWDRVSSFSDFYRLDLDTFTWKRLETNLGELGVSGIQHHACAVDGDWMFVYGGMLNGSQLVDNIFVTRLGFSGNLHC